MGGPGRPTLDLRKVRIYLDDHHAGATAGLRRLRHTAHTLEGTAAGTLVAQVADQIEEEKAELTSVMDRLGLRRSGVKQALAWAGERAAMLKDDGRLLRRTSMNTLLEVELLRSAVMGKRGLWQTLAGHAGDLGLDAARMAYLAERSERQIATLDEVHAFVSARALLSRAPAS